MQRMRNSNMKNRQTVQVISIICAVVFFLFSFVFLYLVHPCYLSQLQYSSSGGTTMYHPTLGALLITVVLTLLGVVTQHFLRFPIRFLALSWFPSSYVLTLLTHFNLSGFTSYPHTIAWGWLVSAPLLYIIFARLSYTVLEVNGEKAGIHRYLYSNLVLLSLFFVYAGSMSNTYPQLRKELQIVHAAGEGKFEDVLTQIPVDEAPTPMMSAYCAYSLCRKGCMGDSLFHYPMLYQSESIAPYKADSCRIYDLAPMLYREFGAKPSNNYNGTFVHFLELAVQQVDSVTAPLQQYLLCAYLLERNLEKFMPLVQQVYDIKQDTLPRHYGEAVVLYKSMSNLKSVKKAVYACDSLQTEYVRFLHDCDSLPLTEIPLPLQHTYWWYFHR